MREESVNKLGAFQRPSSSAEAADEHKEETRSGLSGSAIIVAEKLLARLPETGGLLVIGPVSEISDDDYLTGQLALALQLATSKPTLLVRAAPSRLTQPRVGETPDGPGLTDVLAGAANLEQVLSSPRDRQFTCLGYGTLGHRTAELVMSQAFQVFIKDARLRFHWILMQCPYALDNPQAASSIAHAQAVVATLKQGRGRAESVRTVRDLCEQFNRLFAGVILT